MFLFQFIPLFFFISSYNLFNTNRIKLKLADLFESLTSAFFIYTKKKKKKFKWKKFFYIKKKNQVKSSPCVSNNCNIIRKHKLATNPIFSVLVRLCSLGFNINFTCSTFPLYVWIFHFSRDITQFIVFLIITK